MPSGLGKSSPRCDTKTRIVAIAYAGNNFKAQGKAMRLFRVDQAGKGACEVKETITAASIGNCWISQFARPPSKSTVKFRPNNRWTRRG